MRQQLTEHMEGLETKVQEHNSLATWLSVHLPYAETSPQLASLFKEADRLRDEGDAIVSTKLNIMHSHYQYKTETANIFC